MKPALEKGVVFSSILHGVLFLLALFGLPSFFDRQRDMDPMVITVELLPVTGKTNIKPMSRPAEEKPPEPEPEVKKPEEPKKPTPPVNTSTPPPPPPKQPAISKPAEKKPELKTEPKPEPKPEEKKPPKEKPKEDDLQAVLKAVRDTAQKKPDSAPIAPTEANDNKNNSTSFDPNQMMSMSEKDAIRSQIAKCWSVPAGARDAHELIIVLSIMLEQDGSVTKVELANSSKARYSQDSFFRAAADSAMRAVRQCSPLKNLPPEKFSAWREIELTFDPKEMLF